MKQSLPFFTLALLLLLLFSCNETGNGENNTLPNNGETLLSVKSLSYSLIATHPHDTSSYTQGLQFYKGRLFEGTGLYGSSALFETDLSTGKKKKGIELDKAFFGEGITIVNDTIYQLTWKEQKVFVYTLDFKKIKELSIDKEGWGLTYNGKELILSNGSGELFFYDPLGFRLVRTQLVTENGSPSYNLNEMEYVDGYVYVNQYNTPNILKIDPQSGQVVAKADITSLWDQAKQRYPQAEVPNGIAYDANTKKFYVTGKWWPQLFELQFSQ
jgi:glutamine cyclotransferase